MLVGYISADMYPFIQILVINKNINTNSDNVVDNILIKFSNNLVLQSYTNSVFVCNI